MLVYNAGCTIDDTVLPEHVTEPNDLDRLINGTFRLFLAALPTSPTIVTIARYKITSSIQVFLSLFP